MFISSNKHPNLPLHVLHNSSAHALSARRLKLLIQPEPVPDTARVFRRRVIPQTHLCRIILDLVDHRNEERYGAGVAAFEGHEHALEEVLAGCGLRLLGDAECCMEYEDRSEVEVDYLLAGIAHCGGGLWERVLLVLILLV